jgi:integrase
VTRPNKKKRPHVPGVTVYPRGKKWAFILYLEPDLLIGKRERIYEGGFDTEDDAWDRAIGVKADVDAGRPVRSTNVTVEHFFAEWLTSIKDAVKPTTYANYVDNIDAYIAPVLGRRKLREIDVQTLNAFYRHLLAEGRRKADTNTVMYEYWRLRRHHRDGLGPPPAEIAKACRTTIYAARAAVLRYRRGRIPVAKTAGLEPKSVRNVHRLIHRAFSDAIGWQYLTFNPAAHARLPRLARKGKNRPQPWTVEELAARLKVAMTDRFSGMWVLAATTGMRRSELAGAERNLLDLEAGVLVIEDTRVVVNGRSEDSDGKGESSRRTISLDAFTVTALAEYVAMLDEERTAFGACYPDHGKLMCFENGDRLHPDTVTRRFNRLVDRAGVRPIRLHDIRHTYVTLARDHGVDSKVVTDRVGHASENVTRQIYTHRSVGFDRAAADTLAAMIEKAVKASA